MKILHINTYAGRGGAARVAQDINTGLNARGHESFMICDINKSKDRNVASFGEISPSLNPTMCKFLSKITNLLNTVFGLQDIFHNKYSKLKKSNYYKDADIIHLHNIHGYYFSLLDLLQLGLDKKPIVWTLHDDWAITGKCGFSLDCKRWKSGCGRCPYKKLYPRIFLDTSGLFWKIKGCIYSKIEFTLVTPSKWLQQRVDESPLLKNRTPELVYNGIDTSVFKKGGKKKLRDKYGIPQEKFVILYIADGGKKNTWKGGHFIERLTKELASNKNNYVISIGNSSTKETKYGKEFGYVTNQETLSELYSIADVFLYPSLADNCPLVVLEAIACELPIVAFSTGGIPELVKHKENGYVAEYNNFADLKKGVEFCQNTKFDREKIEKFSKDKVIDDYIAIYEGLLNR